jgi:hypothetical protein
MMASLVKKAVVVLAPIAWRQYRRRRRRAHATR